MKKDKHRILIIKTGYSEILDNIQNSTKPSYGDILRTTPLLHIYKDDHVTWLTDPKASPLLNGNPYISRLLQVDFTTAMQLLDEEFDTLINLEKNHDLCNLARRIESWRKYGFRFDKKSERAEAYDRDFDILAVSTTPQLKRENRKTSQELLFEMVGEIWKGEEYVLGYQPKSKENPIDLHMHLHLK